MPVTAFGKTAENCAKHLAKGSPVCVLGEIVTDKYKDDEGKDVHATKVRALRVIFLGRKKGEGQPERPEAGEDLGPAFPSDASGMDDVPF